MAYSRTDLTAIYELGRLYYEMGYFAPAERIFAGLCAVDGAQTPSRLGLGLVKIERGLIEESMVQLRQALQSGLCPLETKLGLCASFIAAGDIERARSLLTQIETEHREELSFNLACKTLWEAYVIRCE